MIRYTQGNLLDAPVEALVNTVNEMGVMGKGIALQFKSAFPDNTRLYAEACKNKELKVGKVFLTRNQTLLGPKWIVNFPTKQHWRNPSQLSWIRDGLEDLRKIILMHRIESIAIPPLGCGNGGLDWALVRPEMVSALGDLPDVDVVIYEPAAAGSSLPRPRE